MIFIVLAAASVLAAATRAAEEKLTANDGAAGDFFGSGVAISGDTLVVGAPNDDAVTKVDQGSVYVFVRSGGLWTQQQKLTASDGRQQDTFGRSVAINGDTLIAGAPLGDVGNTSNVNEGLAYVFVRIGGVWAQQQKLVASDGAPGDFFGLHVAISGDTAVVGTHIANRFQGVVYVFVRSGGIWTQQQKLTASDGSPQDNFASAAISGDTLFIGAVGDDIGANLNQGSAYVFVRSGGIWTEQQKLTASDGASFSQFGQAVAINGDTLVASAPGAIVGGNVRQGAAYVFRRSGGAWTEQEKLTASEGAGENQLGEAVAMSGDTLVLGAKRARTGAAVDQGAAWVFVRTGGVWTQQQKLMASDGATHDNFAWSVAVGAEGVAAGSPGKDVGANADQGAVYVFPLPPSAIVADVATDAQQIIDANPGTQLAKKLEQTVSKLQGAAAMLAQAPPDRRGALREIQDAVGDLEALVNQGRLSPAQADPLMDDLAGAARMIAKAALDEATARSGNPTVISDAQQDLTDGDALRAAGAFKQAVKKYEDALTKAEGA